MTKSKGIKRSFKSLFSEIGILYRASVNVIQNDGFVAYIKIASGMPVFKLTSHLWSCMISETNIKDILGSKMYLENSRGRGERSLHTWGCHEPLFTKVIMEELKPGMTIVDIGANFGYYVLLEAKRIGNTGKVYAIEPEPDNFRRLQANIALNKYINIEPFNIAAGDTNGIKTLYQSESPNLHNLLGESSTNGPSSSYIGQIKVKTMNLDEFLKDKQPPDLIRMDAEGYEYYIVEGMKNTLHANRSMKIFMELHTLTMKNACLDLTVMMTTLTDAGFKPKYFIRRTLQHPWQNPLSEKIDLKAYEHKGSLLDLCNSPINADGLLVEKVAA
jgi:FkbM family methyltransferase